MTSWCSNLEHFVCGYAVVDLEEQHYEVLAVATR